MIMEASVYMTVKVQQIYTKPFRRAIGTTVSTQATLYTKKLRHSYKCTLQTLSLLVFREGVCSFPGVLWDSDLLRRLWNGKTM